MTTREEDRALRLVTAMNTWAAGVGLDGASVRAKLNAGNSFVAGWEAAERDRERPLSPWIPLDPDGLPPETYPFWRRQEQERRGVA